jgi:WASH complex subunit strumpellin
VLFLSRALIAEFKAHHLDPSTTPTTPKPELLAEVNKYLEAAGLHNPYHKIYITVRNSHYIPLFFFLFVVSHLPKMQFVKNVGTLLPKKSGEFDNHPMVVGVLTILRQFHNDVLLLFLDYLAQYAMSCIVHNNLRWTIVI